MSCCLALDNSYGISLHVETFALIPQNEAMRDVTEKYGCINVKYYCLLLLWSHTLARDSSVLRDVCFCCENF